MRKWTGILFAAVMMAQLTACGQGNNAIESTTAQTTVESTEAETTVLETESETGSESGESAESNKSEDEILNKIHESVKEVYGEDYIPSMPYDDEMLMQVFNVDPTWCEAYIAEGPMMSAHVDTFIGIKAAEGMGDNIEKALTEYQDMMINNSMQYPMNQLKVQASQVVRHDDYVFFVLLGHIPEDIEDEEAGLEAAKESNQKAVDTIDGFFK